MLFRGAEGVGTGWYTPRLMMISPSLADAPTTVSTEHLLYGADPMPRIVAVEPAGLDRMRIMRRTADGVLEHFEDAFRPWLVAERREPWAALPSRPEVSTLDGAHRLRYLIRFPSWSSFSDAARAGRDANEPMFRFRSPVEQYLVAGGRTLFKDLVYDDLRRVQLDIETTGFDPNQPTAQLIVVAIKASSGEEDVFTLDTTEADLLERVTERLTRLDPDVLEGHNIFNFDLPFMLTRASRLGVPLRWGRDGSVPRVGQGQQRFKVGALTIPFSPVYVYGRHVVDTYQQIQRYDTAGRLGSYGLKNAVEALGLTRPNREFVPGEQIRDVWMSDRDRLLRYALDDVRDVDVLSRLAVPTEFYQTQLLPRSFQSVATGGPGEKINDLMVRAYIAQGHSVPVAGSARDYPGGHAELIASGAFGPVVKCDVESLYPSIMLTERITSATDTLGAYLPMLSDLTRRRLEAKAKSRTTIGAERAMWEGLQSSFKVLINSFYGYLGYSGGVFNDFDAAERVTLVGQRIIKQVVDEVRATGGTPIEVDTDGVYFVPPPDVASEAAEHAYVERLAAALPAGIRLAHDGRFEAMLSLRVKTYGLLGYDGSVALKGSSLRSRRMEACFRAFLQEATIRFLRNERDAVRDAYFALGERIRDRSLDVHDFSQWSMLNAETLKSHPRLKRLIQRMPENVRSGDRIAVYERQDGELALVDEYQNDESIGYLLRRLRDTASRFRALFDTESEFDAFFPALTPRTDLDAARTQEAAAQLSLFGD